MIKTPSSDPVILEIVLGGFELAGVLGGEGPELRHPDQGAGDGSGRRFENQGDHD